MKKRIVHIGFAKTLCGLRMQHVNNCIGPEAKPLASIIELIRHEERLCLTCLKVKKVLDKNLKAIKREKRLV